MSDIDFEKNCKVKLSDKHWFHITFLIDFELDLLYTLLGNTKESIRSFGGSSTVIDIIKGKYFNNEKEFTAIVVKSGKIISKDFILLYCIKEGENSDLLIKISESIPILRLEAPDENLSEYFNEIFKTTPDQILKIKQEDKTHCYQCGGDDISNISADGDLEVIYECVSCGNELDKVFKGAFRISDYFK